ncbi:MAG: Fic family protein [bacterium]|nr:Fic family protein [bacterium]
MRAKKQEFSFACEKLDYYCFIDELLQAVSALEAFKAKLQSKAIDMKTIMSSFEKKDCLMSCSMEGCQASLEDLFSLVIVEPSNKNVQLVSNCSDAMNAGRWLLSADGFSENVFLTLYDKLCDGTARYLRNLKNRGAKCDYKDILGMFYKTADPSAPPPYAADNNISGELRELSQYLNAPSDNYHPLILAALLHAQFARIQPFNKYNELINRMLIPLYMFYDSDIDYPYLFISESLSKDQPNYVRLLRKTQNSKNWNEWVKYFLSIVAKQCRKYVVLLERLSEKYYQDRGRFEEIIKSDSTVYRLINMIYIFPAFNAKLINEASEIPMASLNRYLSALTEAGVLYTDGRKRNRIFFNSSLMSILNE